MFKELKEFAVKGNVVDMAVGIIIGAAFTTVVKSVVDDIFMPLLGWATGGLDFGEKFLVLSEGATPGTYASLAQAKAAGATVIAYGNLINATVTFIIVSVVLFFMVRGINRLRSPDTPPAPNTKPCPYCKSPVNIKATRCPQCTSELQAADAD